MKHFLLKLVFFGIVFLGACSKSEFDACYKAETEKLRLSHRLAMTVEQNELVNDVLPILLTDTADKKTLWNDFFIAEDEWKESFKGEKYSDLYWSDHSIAKQTFPHYEELKRIDAAYDRAFDLMDEFSAYDANFNDTLANFCEQKLNTDPYCLDMSDFLVSSIEEAFIHPDFPMLASRNCVERSFSK